MWELDQISSRRHPSQTSSGGWKGASLSQATCLSDCLELLGRMNYNLSSNKNVSCPVGRAQPLLTWEYFGQGRLAWQFKSLLGRSIIRVKEAEKKTESSSDSWVRRAVLSCFPKKWDDATMKMFLCLSSTLEDSLPLLCQVTEDKLTYCSSSLHWYAEHTNWYSIIFEIITRTDNNYTWVFSKIKTKEKWMSSLITKATTSQIKYGHQLCMGLS